MGPRERAKLDEVAREELRVTPWDGLLRGCLDEGREVVHARGVIAETQEPRFCDASEAIDDPALRAYLLAR